METKNLMINMKFLKGLKKCDHARSGSEFCSTDPNPDLNLAHLKKNRKYKSNFTKLT